VQLYHYHFRSGDAFVRMEIDRDTAAIVDYSYGIINVDRYINAAAIAGQCLIDGVVDNFINQVVKPVLTCRPNVHSRSQANRLQTLEHFDTTRVVDGVVVLSHFV
jgi:hypothetical protein